MHFLSEVIKTPELKDPFNNHKNIHRHFYRYSRGDFLGPALKITKTNARITLKSTHEYEDLILEIVARTISKELIEIKGVLITGSNIKNVITDLGYNWTLKKSTGKIKNYKAEIIDTIDKKTLLESIETFRKDSYYLLSFNLSPTCKITTKKRLPQPSKKKIEEDDLSKRIQFCTGIINNINKNLQLILDLAIIDFKAELPSKWKNITIKNNYLINDLVLPKDIGNWGLKRIMAVRKGKMIRSIDIDGELIEKQYNIIV